jgi:hypothetical protein
MAPVLNVPDNLQAMASRWQTQAADLLGASLRASTMPSSQPSSAAKSATLAQTRSALTRLSARIDATANKVGVADFKFDDDEAASAAELRAGGERAV